MAKANPISVQKYLKGIDYPATTEELIQHAQEQGADEDVLSILEELPEDEEFDSPTDLSAALGDLE
ncbi:MULTISPECIES: DUF2795 domain-containing protein [Calothrix]|uniref:DUF2795 domain-containing protein n=2 Tax=Calothrix TaxID=1186 RepID=A0ABR8A6A9_9CYAN|nr:MULTISPECIES: DUF2795 domain-containing protein [Calothrix]MBD2194606.1 DUF2795 domain-containing protein [Calothrix parietina FACHB-288]MBD2223288.1 DUF2795 domain-containing protein [Calothrix anomala FACHB-343]